MVKLLAIAAGAAVGANLRYGIALWAAARFGAGFPVGTLIVNVLGSAAIGALAALLVGKVQVSETLRLLLVTGLLGGFTTFSSFSLELYQLALAGRWAAAGLYLVASVGLGLAGLLLGVAAVRLLP